MSYYAKSEYYNTGLEQIGLTRSSRVDRNKPTYVVMTKVCHTAYIVRMIVGSREKQHLETRGAYTSDEA